MAKPAFRFTEESQTRFYNNVKKIHSMTTAALPKVMRNAGRDFCRFAMTKTPMARGRVFGKGFAKSGWAHAMTSLGMVIRSQHHQRGGKHGLAMGDFKKYTRRNTAGIEVANQVPYIEELDRGSGQNKAYHILQHSLDRTNKQMEKSLDKMARRRKRKWLS